MRLQCTVQFSVVCVKLLDKVITFPSFTNNNLLALISVLKNF